MLGAQRALEGWVRGVESAKAEPGGQDRRSREEAAAEALAGLRAQLAAHEQRAAALQGGWGLTGTWLW